jgi:phage head maturation protease
VANKVLRLSGQAFYKAVEDGGNGSFVGRAAGIGNVDRGGDVIAPGAFDGALDGFLKGGSVLVGHDWGDVPVAMPVSAWADNRSLHIEAEFHSDDSAQRVRRVMAERGAAGLETGLSIGFRVGEPGYVFFRTAGSLVEYAMGRGMDLDYAQIAGHEGPCWLVEKVEELFEVSVVTVPMNPRAVAGAVKDVFGGDGSQVPMTLEDHIETVLAAVEGVKVRLARYLGTRSADGRPVSPERLAQAHDLLRSLDALVADMAAPLEDSRAADAEVLVLRARAFLAVDGG